MAIAFRHDEMYDNNRTSPLSLEHEWVRAAQSGDYDAFGFLVKRHERRARATALAIVRSAEDADDVVQTAFGRAFRSLARFRPDQSFGAWLHRIVINTGLDFRRRRAARETEPLSDAMPLTFIDPAEASELHERLNAAVSTLANRHRSVLVLHDVQGFTHGEIGEMLGIPEGTARSLLFHARRSVRRLLAPVRSDL